MLDYLSISLKEKTYIQTISNEMVCREIGHIANKVEEDTEGVIVKYIVGWTDLLQLFMKNTERLSMIFTKLLNRLREYSVGMPRTLLETTSVLTKKLQDENVFTSFKV
jgi:hypothetical protein